MSNKNRRNKGQNTASKSPVTSQVPKQTTISPEEKEGVDIKQKLVAEGEAEKNRIIDEAKEEARKVVATEKEKIKAEYISQVKEQAENDALEQRKKILSDAEELKIDTETKLKQVEEESKSFEERSKILEKQIKEYNERFLKFNAQKETYKNEISLMFQTELEELQKRKETLEKEKYQLEQMNTQLERNISFSNADKEELEYELSNYNELYQENAKFKASISRLESENTVLYDQVNGLQKEINEKNNKLLRIGDDPQRLLMDNDALNKEIIKLRDVLANTPDISEIEKLRERNQQYSQIQQQNETLRTEKIKIEKELFNAKTYQADLENKDRFIRVLELQCTELQTELDRITDRYNKNSTKVFAGLSRIDEEVNYPNHGKTNKTLKEFCTGFKNWLASKKGLYYTDAHIRTFIAGMASSRIIILEGMSGTGKSSLPREFGEFIGSPTVRIPVQSSWKDRNDLLGFYNDFEKRYKETDFIKAIYNAVRDTDNIHCILLDEMNISRIEYYFADLLSVLEEPDSSKWKISLVPDAASVKGEMPKFIHNGELLLSENIWFAGTANKDDSTFTITDKVYDRAIVLDFKERAQEPTILQSSNINVSSSEFQELIKKAVNPSSGDRKKIDEMIEYLDFKMQGHFEISFGNRISSQIKKFVPAYVNCGGGMVEAFDILFSSKVLRKIQGYDKSTEKGLSDILAELNDDYPNSNDFTNSKALIKKMQSRI